MCILVLDSLREFVVTPPMRWGLTPCSPSYLRHIACFWLSQFCKSQRCQCFSRIFLIRGRLRNSPWSYAVRAKIVFVRMQRPTKKRMGSLPTWRPGASFRLRNASDSFERPKNICRIAASSSRKGPSVTPVPFQIVRALEFDSVCVYLGV